MAEKKKIPCRVCGKLFVPCAYCQEHADVFRWRNFACSRECAYKYINDTIAYRESLDKKDTVENKVVVKEEVNEEVSDKPISIKKRNYKKSSETQEDGIKDELENKKTD